MVARRMVWPDPADPGRSADNPLSSATAPRLQRDDKIPLEHLAELLQRSGSQSTPPDPKLRLNLSRIAEQACLATPATGAAIALRDGPDFLCCASWGTHAPAVGARLSADSGLSGICVREKQTQRCDDTEADARVDPVACRQLQVRSLLVMPLLRDGEVAGIIEVFSPHPRAFGTRDLDTLKILAGRIMEELAPPKAVPPPAEPSAQTPAASPPPAEEPAPAAPPEKLPVAEASSEPLGLPPPAFPESAAPVVRPAFPETSQIPDIVLQASPPLNVWAPPPRRPDRTTTILVALVIALAILLGWMIGHFGWQSAPGPEIVANTPSAEAHPAPSPGIGSQGGPANDAAQPAADPAPKSPAEKADARPAAPSRLASLPQSRESPRSATSSGGLVVYQEGKVIFQQTSPPAGSYGESQPITPTGLAILPSEEATTFLIHRVEPHYPDLARKERIQGAVLLDVWVGTDGAVQTVHTVSGNDQLVDAAADAVRQWRFRPYAPKGKPVEFTTRLTVDFVLQNKP